jgi:hypothetical protein
MKTYICVLLEKLSQNSGQVRLLLNENIAVSFMKTSFKTLAR